ncbi:MAG TPA: hypothetical protein VGM41_17115 [Chitinophagaceae bacterium]|jgi:hypothetical protein
MTHEKAKRALFIVLLFIAVAGVITILYREGLKDAKEFRTGNETGKIK